MKYLLTLISFSICFCVFSQQKIIDSLSLELEHYNAPTEKRLFILSELVYNLSFINPKRGLELSDKAITLAGKLNQKDKLATVLKYKAANYTANSQDSMALITYDKALKINKTLGDEDSYARTTFNKGLVYFKRSMYQKANACNRLAYTIFEKQKDSFLMAKMLNSIGINQMYLSKYPEAIDTYLKSSRFYEKLNLTKSVDYASILGNIGLIYGRLDKHDKANEYQEKALKIYKVIDYQLGLANTYTNIGNNYDNLKQPKKALSYYDNALEIMERINDKSGIASALTNKAIALSSLKNYTESNTFLIRTKVMYKALGNATNLAIVNENLGANYLELSKINTNRTSLLNQAKQYYQEGYTSALKVTDLKTQASILNGLASVDAHLKNYKAAYTNKEQAIILKDSFLSTEKKSEIAKLEAKYEYDKKEAILQAENDKEQALANVEIKRQKLIKNGTILGGSGLILVSFFGFIAYRRREREKTKTKDAKFLAKVAETELKALRAQMNPHFIFNSLNSIGDYILKNDTKSANDYLTKFAKLMRLTLESSEKKEVLLSEDIALLKTYLDIENKRFNNSFSYTINIDIAIDQENTLVPPLILQPFIENSIIHGLNKKEGTGKIVIDFKKDNNMIICSVDDNGIGRKSTESSKSLHKQSLGMKLTKNRIDIINKRKNSNGSIKVIDKDQGLRVEVMLPLELAF